MFFVTVNCQSVRHNTARQCQFVFTASRTGVKSSQVVYYIYKVILRIVQCPFCVRLPCSIYLLQSIYLLVDNLPSCSDLLRPRYLNLVKKPVRSESDSRTKGSVPSYKACNVFNFLSAWPIFVRQF